MAMADTDRDRKERNYELVGQAMRNFLAPALESWIKRELQKPKNLKTIGIYDGDWRYAARKPLNDYNHDGTEPYWYDCQAVLKIISHTEYWNKIFKSNKIGFIERGLIETLRRVRNDNSHNNVAVFTTDYSLDVLSAITRLLTAIGDPRAQDAEQLKQEFVKQYYEELSEIGKKSVETGINWFSYGAAMWERQKSLSSNALTANEGIAFKLDDIYVPLGLVERQKLLKRPKAENTPEDGSDLYREEYREEITRKFEGEDFYVQVLKNRQSDKSKGTRLAITGEPGAGKTTQLQKIGDWVWAEMPENLVIWVSLADLQGRRLDEYLLDRWLKDALQVARVKEDTEANFVEFFKSGRVWLLLDGVDEMAEANPLSDIAKQISGWVAQARVILTCRQNVWDAGNNHLYDFDVYRNLDWTPGQVNQVIDKWFGENPARGKTLQAELEKSGKERIRDAVRNPLRLTLLCRTWLQREGELPETKAQLYRQFTEAFYLWKQESFPTTGEERRELEKALGELALAAISGEDSRFRLTHRQVCNTLGDGERYQLAIDLGWLNQVGVAAENPSEKVYAFWHPTFEEYFAALAVDDWHFFLTHVPENPAAGTYRIFEKQWKEVILLWLGRDDVPKVQKEAFIEALVDFEDGCEDLYAYQAFFLAAAGIAEFKDCSISKQLVDSIVYWGCGWLNIQNKQVEIISIYPIVEIAREVLLHCDRNMAIQAVVSLLETDIYFGVLVEATKILGKIGTGNEMAIAVLVKVIEEYHPNNEWLVINAASSLGEIAFEQKIAIKCMENLIVNTSGFDVYLQAIKSLVQMDPSNEDPLNELVEEFITTCLKYNGIDTDFIDDIDMAILGEMASVIESIGVGHQNTINAFINLLETIDKEYLRPRLVIGLGKIAIGNEKAISALCKLIQVSKSEDTRRVAAANLENISPGNPIAITALQHDLETYTSNIKPGRSATSLSIIAPENEAIISDWQEILESSNNRDLLWKTAIALVAIDPDNAIAMIILESILKESNKYWIRWKRYFNDKSSITKNNQQVAVKIIKNLLKHRNYESDLLDQASLLTKIAPNHEMAVALQL